MNKWTQEEIDESKEEAKEIKENIKWE